MADEVDPQQLAEQLLAQAKAQGVDLVGPNGQLNQLAEGCASPSRPRRRRHHSALVRASVAGRLADQRADVRRQGGVPLACSVRGDICPSVGGHYRVR